MEKQFSRQLCGRHEAIIRFGIPSAQFCPSLQSRCLGISENARARASAQIIETVMRPYRNLRGPLDLVSPVSLDIGSSAPHFPIFNDCLLPLGYLIRMVDCFNYLRCWNDHADSGINVSGRIT
jgi:hypothetical protein